MHGHDSRIVEKIADDVIAAVVSNTRGAGAGATCCDITAARAAVLEVLRPMMWRDIESAPKDREITDAMVAAAVRVMRDSGVLEYENLVDESLMRRVLWVALASR